MTKILGLDLGTNSIGWAVVDKESKKILDTGVRIFPEGVEPTSIGKGDNEQSKNATRRDKRQARRQFYRKRLRKIKLLEVLIDQQMCPLELTELYKWKNWNKELKSDGRLFPQTPMFIEWLKLNPYSLRDKAVKEQVSLYELGRIFYHMIQHRGFLSNRKGKEDSTIFTKGKADENILPINETKAKLTNQTLGQYLSSISSKENKPYQTIKDENGKEIRVRGRYTVRDMYIAEFEKIWEKQSKFSNINDIKVISKKTREFRGSLEAKRNKSRISYLQNKYGTENTQIEKVGLKGITKVTTKTTIPLKTYLAGEISTKENENGEKVLEFKSNESVLFWQRPLRSQKGTLSNCRFEDKLPVIGSNGEFLKNKGGKIQLRSKKPCPVSHPEFEYLRTLQFINNIKYGKNQTLTNEQKADVLDLINSEKGNFDFVKIPKKLKITYEKFNYENKFKVSGNPTIKQIRPLFTHETWEEHYESIWHCFSFYEDNKRLFEKLKDFGLKKEKDIKAIEKIRLKDGYSNVSLKAIRNITPFLEKGYLYDRAVILGGIKNAFGKQWGFFKDFHSNIEKEILSILKEDNKDGEAIEKIKEHLSSPAFHYGFSKNDPRFTKLYHHSQEIEKKDPPDDKLPEVENLRNPIVQQGINELRRLVNLLMLKYKNEFGPDFHFDQIHVEMGRDLRRSKSQRQEMSFRINDNERKNNEARERLAEFGLQPSRSNIQKYLMYREIENRGTNVQCPYTGKTISIYDLLGFDNAIQIEHIIPYSISLDDSFGNKTLCEANFNREKGEKTPYQFYLANPDYKLWGIRKYQNPEDGWNEITERAFRLLPYQKAKKFTVKRKFEKSDFIQRQLNDSRYIAKKSVELLSNICKDVRVMPGQLTAELRHLWGLNNILQPIENLNKQQYEVSHKASIPYYVIANEKHEIISIQKKQNERPETDEHQILSTGYISKNRFSSKFFKIDIDAPDLKDGKYWAKLNVSDQLQLIPKYTEKPITDEDYIVFRGKIEKGLFKNDTTGNIKTQLEEGNSYWAKFEIINKQFESPEKDKQPKTKHNQVILFGNVTNGEFKCYIYQCQTNLPDGKYWIILDLNINDIEFTRAVSPEPVIENQQLLILATVDETGLMVADSDTLYKKRTNQSPGKYYAILEIENKTPQLYKIENDPPKTEKGQELIEGNIWVDKYTGEIKFDPKKNRDDHRHHAIDAITIALTEQAYLQRLSTYNAECKEKIRGKLDSTEKFPEPWDSFGNDVKKAANSILVSHKKNNKTLTKNRKGFSVRGQLHKENVFGKRKAPKQEKGFHRRTKITDLGNNKHVHKVVDDTIRELIRNHLRDNCGVDTDNTKGYSIPKDAFFKDGEWRLFLPNKKGDPVPIKKVRIKENIGNAVQLKSDLNQYVNPRNNHHVLVYKDHDGNLKEEVVQFWTVVERKLQGNETYQLPEDGKQIVATLEINDMFLLGLNNDEYESNQSNDQFLSKYLYRVQKFTSGDYYFRHHLASTINNQNEKLQINSFGHGKNGWLTHNPIKVKINTLGEIEQL